MSVWLKYKEGFIKVKFLSQYNNNIRNYYVFPPPPKQQGKAYLPYSVKFPQRQISRSKAGSAGTPWLCTALSLAILVQFLFKLTIFLGVLADIQFVNIFEKEM